MLCPSPDGALCAPATGWRAEGQLLLLTPSLPFLESAEGCSHHSTPVLWGVTLEFSACPGWQGTRDSTSNSVGGQKLSGGGRGGCGPGSRHGAVAAGIRRVCHSFISLKRGTEGPLPSSHRQMAEKAFHMFLLSHMLCYREAATGSGTEILIIGVICAPFFISCQTEQ